MTSSVGIGRAIQTLDGPDSDMEPTLRYDHMNLSDRCEFSVDLSFSGNSIGHYGRRCFSMFNLYTLWVIKKTNDIFRS